MSQSNLFNLTELKDRVRLAGSPVEKLQIAKEAVAKMPVPSGHLASVACPKCGELLSVIRGPRSKALMIFHPAPAFRVCKDSQKWIAEGEEAETLYRELSQPK